MLAALVQVNFCVGALPANAAKIVRLAREATERGAGLIVFPEMALTGYPPEDLVLKRHFQEDVEAQLVRLAVELPHGPAIVVGAPRADDGCLYNTAVVFQKGEIRGTYRKMLLPNYGVFDEKRLFAPGTQPMILELGRWRMGLHICEDSWLPEDPPCRALRGCGLDVVVNLSASPYHAGKLGQRAATLGHTARTLGVPLLYCNLVGGQDELVFDGGSLALDAAGKIVARAVQFRDAMLFVEIARREMKQEDALPSLSPQPSTRCLPPALIALAPPPAPAAGAPPGRIEPDLDEDAEIYAALELGLRDYADKNGFSDALVALSGGIDSALVAALAVDTLGAQRVHAITLPSRFSSPETFADALLVAKQLGIVCQTLAIREIVAVFERELAALWPGRAPDVTEENLQARVRGTIAMSLSNKFGWLALSTGNKSELATGYCTLYGDMCGGFAVLKDAPKTLVYRLARWRNRRAGSALIPERTIARPPTAELRPGQQDSDSLPPYAILDPILERYVEQDQSLDQIVAAGFDPAVVERVIRLVDRNEYKRRQGAPGIKITPKSFGRDRRMPITNLYDEYRTRGTRS